MWPDESGDWGLDAVVQWVDPTGTTPQNGPQVQANDVFTQSTVSNGPDKYGGWFGSLLDKGISYALARDAQKRGLVPVNTPNGQQAYQPAVATAAGPGAMSSGAVLMIGGAVVVGLLLVALTGRKG